MPVNNCSRAACFPGGCRQRLSFVAVIFTRRSVGITCPPAPYTRSTKRCRGTYATASLLLALPGKETSLGRYRRPLRNRRMSLDEESQRTTRAARIDVHSTCAITPTRTMADPLAQASARRLRRPQRAEASADGDVSRSKRISSRAFAISQCRCKCQASTMGSQRKPGAQRTSLPGC